MDKIFGVKRIIYDLDTDDVIAATDLGHVALRCHRDHKHTPNCFHQVSDLTANNDRVIQRFTKEGLVDSFIQEK